MSIISQNMIMHVFTNIAMRIKQNKCLYCSIVKAKTYHCGNLAHFYRSLFDIIYSDEIFHSELNISNQCTV